MPSEVLEQPKTDSPICNVSKIKSLVNDAVENSVHSVSQAVTRGRHVAEDFIEEAQHTVKQNPFQTVGVAFAAGILTGGILAWLAFRRR